MSSVAPDGGFVQGSGSPESPRAMVLYFIPVKASGRLAIAKRPRSGQALEGELARVRAQGGDVLVSLLSPHEVIKLGLEHERELAEAAGLEFLTFPIDDHGLPASDVAVTRFSAALAQRVAAGSTVVIHCRAGIGRSSMIAAVVLMRVEGGADAKEAMARISQARGLDVPETDAQKAWLRAFRPRL
jgi:protein-tyrosine phosphatase